MSSAAVGVLAYVLVFLICIALSVYATVVIRRCDDTVRDPRAITARYEKKIQEQDTVPYHDWESYYRDGDRGNSDDTAYLPRTGRIARTPRHLRKGRP